MRIAIACDSAKTKYLAVDEVDHDGDERTAQIRLKRKWNGSYFLDLEKVRELTQYGVTVLEGIWKNENTAHQCRVVL